MYPPKYPSTPHWPWSEKVHRDDSYHIDPGFFVGKEVVITEKIDGGNTCLWNGEVYARSTLVPSHDGWMAMVRKHHAWKTFRPDLAEVYSYGEDIYGIHSIEYAPVNENETYRLFAVRKRARFLNWGTVQAVAENLLGVPTVPERFRGTFGSVQEITEWFRENRPKGSDLGPEAEGFVIRTYAGFPAEDFAKHVCKYVRADHVQTDEHWTRNWQPCQIIGRKAQ